jgi:hypothetical protein
VVKLKSPLRQFYRRNHDLGWITVENICVTNDHGYVSFVVIIILSFIHDFSQGLHHKSTTMGATSGAGTAYPNEAHEFTPGFVRVMLLNLLSCVAFCGSLFVLFLLVIIWSVCRLTASD